MSARTNAMGMVRTAKTKLLAGFRQSSTSVLPTPGVMRPGGHGRHRVPVPASLVNVERGHGEQSAACERLKVPGAHKSHAACPTREYSPALHAVHLDACKLEYVPATHGGHSEAPSLEEYVPPLQLRQLRDPLTFAKVPMGQGTQMSRKAVGECPWSHGVHADMPSLLLTVPAGQIAHCFCPAIPEYVPLPQSEQTVEPTELENFPLGQSVQLAAPSTLIFPLSHGWQ